MRCLVEHGARVDLTTPSQNTALHLAACYGQTDMVR